MDVSWMPLLMNEVLGTVQQNKMEAEQPVYLADLVLQTACVPICTSQQCATKTDPLSALFLIPLYLLISPAPHFGGS